MGVFGIIPVTDSPAPSVREPLYDLGPVILKFGSHLNFYRNALGKDGMPSGKTITWTAR